MIKMENNSYEYDIQRIVKNIYMKNPSVVKKLVDYVEQIYLEAFKEGLRVKTRHLSETEQKIKSVMDGMQELLFYKNKKYGDSALHPKQVFCKRDASDSITIRLDDKLSRMINGSDLTSEEGEQFAMLFKRIMGGDLLRKNDVSDFIGYLTLFCASKHWLEFSEFMD